MSMKVYVAGRVSQMERVQVVQEEFRQMGYSITFDWTGPEGEQRKDWSEHADRAQELSTAELEGVQAADGVVLVGDGCAEGEGGLGCFIEVGMAMGELKPVVVIGPCRESVFWYLPGVARVNDHVDACDVMSDLIMNDGWRR